MSSTARALALLAMAMCIVYSSPSMADWALAGAQYSCNQAMGSFELLPFDRSSSDPQGVLRPGFIEIKGAEPNHTCKLGQHTLRAVINVYGPGNGEGMGGGFVRVQSISIGGVELVPDSPGFDFQLSASNPALERIRVTERGDQVTLERCYEDETLPVSQRRPKCRSEQFAINELVARKAVAEHQLADLATQRAENASNLPADNDLANVLAKDHAVPSGVPICAHLRSFFLRNMTADSLNGPIPHARIAGVAGERVYIHPGNPQVCDEKLEPLCRPHSYLIPGDRVDVGFLCGDWAYVRYPRPTNAKNDIDGWVPTKRLYDVDSLVSADSGMAARYYNHYVRNDDLVLAVLTNNIGELKGLLAKGAKVNGSGGDGLPLEFATRLQEREIVAMLLQAGANPNAGGPCTLVIGAAAGTTETIFNMLLKSGLTVHCADRAMRSEAGITRIQALDSDVSTFGRWLPIRDLPALVMRLVSSGISVDAAAPSGMTALYATISNNNVDVAAALLKAGANPNIILHDTQDTADALWGSTPLIAAIDVYGQFLDPTMVKLLLSAGANPNYRTEGQYHFDPDAPDPQGFLAGQTALTFAAEQGYAGIVKILLDHGANPRITRSDGITAAAIAMENGHDDVASLIQGIGGKKIPDKKVH